MAKKSKQRDRKRVLLLLSPLFICGAVCVGIIFTQPCCRAWLSHLMHRVDKVSLHEQRVYEPASYNDAHYASMFNDQNSLHPSAARKVGLPRPLKTRAEADGVKSEFLKITSGDNYVIDNLTTPPILK